METEQQITAAKQVLRRLQARYTHPNARMHSPAAEDNVNRLRALEGLCGNCANLELRFSRRDGRDIVVVGCSKGDFSAALYERTPLGEEASCADHAPIVGK